MEKTITIGNKNVLLKATAGVLIKYKQQFGRDYNADYQELTANRDDEELYSLRFSEIGLHLLWAMAKTADKNVEPPESWLIGVDIGQLAESVIEALVLFNSSFSELEQKSSGSTEGKDFTAESLVAEALICGLSPSDLDDMPLGMVLNTIEEWCKAKGYADDVREATQEDFDNF
jgi:hypothetical protein